MDRPNIICHMVTSLDGKVTGDFLGRDVHRGLIEDYFRIHREYAADGFLCGRVTMEGSFPQPPILPVDYAGAAIERVDHVAESAAFYAVAIDPRGKLWWDESAICDTDDGYNGAHIIEVLTQNVSDAFLTHLRDKGVSYLFGGTNELDLVLVARKLKRLFGIDKLLLEGGGIVNGAFLQANLIDEISLVVIPEIECEEQGIPLFKIGEYYTGARIQALFRLKEVKRLKGDGLWLIYQKH